MAMLKYVKRRAPPNYKPSILSQQDMEAKQKLVADAVYTAANNNESDKRSKLQFIAYQRRLIFGNVCSLVVADRIQK